MDIPTIDVDLGPERIERIQEEKIGGPLVYCDLCDTEVVHKLAQMFLPGLATACVDNTSGDLFKTPGSVADDLRKEMIDYVSQRSESFVAESVILESDPDGEVSDHAFDIISNFVDDFASSKRNLLTLVSGWLLSEKREDKIDDFIQEMEIKGFWSLDRRERIAETFLKNVDFENKFHCSMKFNSADGLANHVSQCNFRPMICQNEGCNARFIAGHLMIHDSTCPFKIIPCEQRCSDNIMRRDMDRHCITVCPMKLVNCPFYAIGCRSAIAQCLIEKHCIDDVQSHLWHLLKGMYKEASGEDLKQRVDQIVQASSGSRLAEARNVRSLNLVVKDIESKLGPFEVRAMKKNSEEIVAKSDDREDSENNTKASESSTKAPDMLNSSDKAEVSAVNKCSAEIAAKNNDGEDSQNNTEGSEPSTKAPDMVNSSDNAEGSDIVNMASSEDTAKNKDGEHSHTESRDREERAQTPNNEAEISLVNKDSFQIYTENEDGANGDFKIEDNKESTQTNMKNLSDKVEISTTKEEDAENGVENKHVEDKDNEQSIHNLKTEVETKGGSDHNVKNKGVEDDNS